MSTQGPRAQTPVLPHGLRHTGSCRLPAGLSSAEGPGRGLPPFATAQRTLQAGRSFVPKTSQALLSPRPRAPGPAASLRPGCLATAAPHPAAPAAQAGQAQGCLSRPRRRSCFTTRLSWHLPGSRPRPPRGTKAPFPGCVSGLLPVWGSSLCSAFAYSLWPLPWTLSSQRQGLRVLPHLPLR